MYHIAQVCAQDKQNVGPHIKKTKLLNIATNTEQNTFKATYCIQQTAKQNIDP